jgi:hypothetical protein
MAATGEYSYSQSIPAPKSIGVGEGIYESIRGVQYYSDVLMYGAPSNGLTDGMDIRPAGANYFVKTGQKCSNGADTWTYVEGIPVGDSLGKTMTRALRETGYPPLKGLAPGAIEDTKFTLNFSELVGTLFNGALPVCKQVTLPVGDIRGNIVDKDGNRFVEGGVFSRNGKYYQTQWIQDYTVKKFEHDCAVKTHNPDGTARRITEIPELPSECVTVEGDKKPTMDFSIKIKPAVKKEGFIGNIVNESANLYWIIGGLSLAAIAATQLLK